MDSDYRLDTNIFWLGKDSATNAEFFAASSAYLPSISIFKSSLLNLNTNNIQVLKNANYQQCFQIQISFEYYSKTEIAHLCSVMNLLHKPIQDTMVGISPSEIVSEDEKQFSTEIPTSPMKKENGDPDPELYDLLNDVEEHIHRVLLSFTLSRKKPNFPLVQPIPNINNE